MHLPSRQTLEELPHPHRPSVDEESSGTEPQACDRRFDRRAGPVWLDRFSVSISEDVDVVSPLARTPSTPSSFPARSGFSTKGRQKPIAGAKCSS
jgi:hypothetical protein